MSWQGAHGCSARSRLALTALQGMLAASGCQRLARFFPHLVLKLVEHVRVRLSLQHLQRLLKRADAACRAVDADVWAGGQVGGQAGAADGSGGIRAAMRCCGRAGRGYGAGLRHSHVQHAPSPLAGSVRIRRAPKAFCSTRRSSEQKAGMVTTNEYPLAAASAGGPQGAQWEQRRTAQRSAA